MKDIKLPIYNQSKQIIQTDHQARNLDQKNVYFHLIFMTKELWEIFMTHSGTKI